MEIRKSFEEYTDYIKNAKLLYDLMFSFNKETDQWEYMGLTVSNDLVNSALPEKFKEEIYKEMILLDL